MISIENVIAKSNRQSPSKAHIGLLRRLHVLCLRAVNEVLYSAKGGYGSIALSRWRTLHEITTVVAAIVSLGKKAATAYINHEAIESCKAMHLFNRYAKQLDEKPYPQKELDAISARRDRLVQKYGKAIKGDYGWGKCSN